jgi:hypothetical protein
MQAMSEPEPKVIPNPAEHYVWRQDDHGNKFLVARVSTKFEAESSLALLVVLFDHSPFVLKSSQ